MIKITNLRIVRHGIGVEPLGKTRESQLVVEIERLLRGMNASGKVIIE